MKIRKEGFVLMLNRSVYLLPSSSVHDIFWCLHDVVSM
jgi:hypothetical protein